MTDNRIVRSDGTSGAIQDSLIQLDDAGNITMALHDIVNAGDVECVTLSAVGGQPVVLTDDLDLDGNSIDDADNINAHGTTIPIVGAYGHADSAAAYGTLQVGHSRNTQASPNAVESGDVLGAVSFQGHDGSSYQTSAFIQAKATENFSAGNEGTELEIYTTADGAGTKTLQVTIEQDGTINLEGNSLSGVGNFGAKGDIVSASAANTPSTLSVGTNGFPLIADSGETTGLRYKGVRAVRATSDEALDTSDALQDDDALTLAVAANTSYIVTGMLFFSCANSAPDVKVAFTVPASTVMDIAVSGTSDPSYLWSYVLQTSGTASGVIHIGAAHVTAIFVSGTIAVVGTAGSLTLRWAQFLSSAFAITRRIGSYLKIEEIV